MLSSDIGADIEASDISSTLNSVILFIFLMGMYTVIYFGTIYVYFAKNSSRSSPVPAVITMLYLLSIAETAFQWYGTKLEFVDDGDNLQSVFMAVFDNPEWMNVGSNLLNCIICVIADGLLIWRCFYVWNRSLRVITLSLFLVVAEFVLFLTEISLNAKYTDMMVSPALAARINALLAAAFFTSFSTTLVTTVLIAYKIYSISKQNGTSRRFKHIVDIVVQSGAVYALSQLTAAIAGVVPGSNTLDNTRVWALQDYGPLLNLTIAGISSTVMVARVAMLSADTTYPSTSAHLSGLQFRARSTQPTVNIDTMEFNPSLDGDRTSSGGEHAAGEKAQ